MEVDRSGLEVLDRHECLRLLGSATIGRVGFTSHALPAVWPVLFRLERERILVRTGRDSTLHGALRGAVVAFEVDAFEVDDFDPNCHSGWSVAVTGVATGVADTPGVDPAPDPLAHPAPPASEVLLAISTELVSGRRIASGSFVTGWRGAAAAAPPG